MRNMCAINNIAFGQVLSEGSKACPEWHLTLSARKLQGRRRAFCAPTLLTGRFLCVMPAFESHPGSPTDERDARGDHDLIFGADEEGELLRTLAPGVFSAGGGAGPITSTYG